MNLTGITHSLEVETGSIQDLRFTASWVDINKASAATSVVPGSNQGSITAITTTTVAAAPATNVYRTITNCSFYNVGTLLQTIKVKKNVGGVKFTLSIAVLTTQESLHYEDSAGWYVLNAQGSKKGIGETGENGLPGSGTVLGFGTSTIDFGVDGSFHASTVVTGQTNILADSLVFPHLHTAVATPEHSKEEHMLENLRVHATDVIAGVGFTLHAVGSSIRSTPGIPRETRLAKTTQNFGPGDAPRATAFPSRGKVVKIKGVWAICWFYTQ